MGYSKTAVLLTILAVILAAGFLGYRYRGAIRLKMLDILHSFDDAPETPDSMAWMDDMPPGLWWPARDIGQERELTPEQQEALSNIENLGYLSGYQEAPYQNGVVLHQPDKAFQGYNIVTSGHGPGVALIDMEGNELHEWYTPEISVYTTWPDAQDRTITVDYWRRVHLYPDGDLVVLIDGGGIVKVDKNSNVLWTSEFNGAHHDLYVNETTGLIYTIGRNIHINPRYSTDEIIVEDYVCILDSLGNEIATIPVLDALENSIYKPLLRRMPPSGDVLHTNTIELIEEGQLPQGYDGPLKENTLLLSMRTIDLVCAFDPEENTVYWAESDLWHMKHQPTMVENGNMLVFDNQGYGEISTVLELSPENREVVWYYRGTEEIPFYSVGCGSCQRLPDGNTLIIESVPGRAFEVTPEKEIVWEYYNPHRAGEHNELIATLFDVVRIPEDSRMDWLDD